MPETAVRRAAHAGATTMTSSQMERLILLRSFEALRALPPEALAAIAEHADDRFFPAGTEIFAEGEPACEIYYVLEGKIEMRRRGITVATLDGRSVVGGLAAMSRVGDGQQAVAVEDSVALAVSHEDMMEVFEDNFEMLVVVIGRIAMALIETRRELGRGAGFSAEIAEVEAPLEPLTVVERLRHLRKQMAFGPSQLEELAELAAGARECRLPAGTTVWREGDPSGRWLVLISGVIAGSSEAHEFHLGPGSTVGGLDSLAGIPRWFDAVCETDIVALELDTEELFDILEDNVDMAVALLRVLSAGLLEFRDRLSGDGPVVVP